MARNIRVELASDLSGKVLDDNDAETVTVALNGKTVELDLSKDEAEDLRSKLEEYFKVGRKVSSNTRSSARSTGARTGTDKEKMAEIRKWASENGFDNVASRGRISANVLEAYEAAQK